VPNDLRTWLERFYALWDSRAMDGLLDMIQPDAPLRDHRALGFWEGSRADWQAMVEGWWELMPDAHVAELKIVGTHDDKVAYFVRIGGHDTVTGGMAENAFYAVNQIAHGQLVATDLFDQEDAALACLGPDAGAQSAQ
jgi:hypothetical protein